MTNEEAIRQLYGTRNLDELAQKFVKEITHKDSDVDRVLNRWLPALWLGQSLGSVAVRISKFRSALKKSRSRKAKEALQKLAFPRDARLLLDAERAEKVEEEKRSEEFNGDEVNALLEKLRDVVINKKFPSPSSRQSAEQIEAYWLAPYIALATGRRFGEVMKTMDMEKHGKKVTIHGLTKKRDGEDTLEYACLLDDYLPVKKALKRLRDILPTEDMTVDEVSKKYSYVFNRYLKEKIAENPDITFHDLRSMYARECWERHKDETKLDEPTFIAGVLGHKKVFTPTDHYIKYAKESKK